MYFLEGEIVPINKFGAPGCGALNVSNVGEVANVSLKRFQSLMVLGKKEFQNCSVLGA